MPLAGFEPGIRGIKRSQTTALEGRATEIGTVYFNNYHIVHAVCCLMLLSALCLLVCGSFDVFPFPLRLCADSNWSYGYSANEIMKTTHCLRTDMLTTSLLHTASKHGIIAMFVIFDPQVVLTCNIFCSVINLPRFSHFAVLAIRVKAKEMLVLSPYLLTLRKYNTTMPQFHDLLIYRRLIVARQNGKNIGCVDMIQKTACKRYRMWGNMFLLPEDLENVRVSSLLS